MYLEPRGDADFAGALDREAGCINRLAQGPSFAVHAPSAILSGIMKQLLLLAGAAALASAAPALAQGHGNGHGNGKGNAHVHGVNGPVGYGVGGCPPGLAKKNNGCLPPGQAKKLYNVGQRYPLGYGNAWTYNQIPYDVRNQYNLDPYGRYYYGDGYLYRVDPTTMLIQQVVSAIIH